MSTYHDLISQLRKLATEQANPHTADIDRLPPLEIARKINDEDKIVPLVVEQALPEIALAAELFAQTLRNNGRVFYIGAGTSGRLGVLDAAECPPTYGTDPKQIIGVISGGYATLTLSQEGVEDRRDAAIADLKQQALSSKDMVIGIAASTRTPYTVSGVQYARSLGCPTAFIICNAPAEPLDVDILIELPVGPEVVTGSTRMKSGTAQKLALNMISTTAMILLGKTWGNLMVDLQVKSDKLAARARRILIDELSVPADQVDALMERAGGSLKLAMVMYKLNCDRSTALQKLDTAGGRLARVFELI